MAALGMRVTGHSVRSAKQCTWGPLSWRSGATNRIGDQLSLGLIEYIRHTGDCSALRVANQHHRISHRESADQATRRFDRTRHLSPGLFESYPVATNSKYSLGFNLEVKSEEQADQRPVGPPLSLRDRSFGHCSCDD